MRWIAPAVVTAVVFGALDALWLGRIGRPLYDDRIGDLLAPRFNIAAALLFYTIYVLGITYFVTVPALEQGSLTKRRSAEPSSASSPMPPGISRISLCCVTTRARSSPST